MFLRKTVAAICIGASLCTALTINISGFVQDSAGAGISGATVSLEKSRISTTTDAGGTFTLSGSLSTKSATKPGIREECPVQIQNGKIAITLSGEAPVGITIHDVGGRMLFGNKTTLGAGSHTISVPMHCTGVYLCNVTIGNTAYSFKSMSLGTFSTKQNTIPVGVSGLAELSKVAEEFTDVILVEKKGQLTYRDMILKPTGEIVIKMIPNAGDLTDADGNIYQTVRIGNQVWMAENLRVTKYNDGTDLPLVRDVADWKNLSLSGKPTYCFCNNTTNADSIKKYGALYNWYVVSRTNEKKISPTGWHVPSNAEWDTLQNYLIANGYNWDGTTTLNKIAKALAAKIDWLPSTTNGTVGTDLTTNNSSGFSAFPSGYRTPNPDPGFYGKSCYCAWWSTTEVDTTTAYYRDLDFYYVSLGSGRLWIGDGLSIRLVKN